MSYLILIRHGQSTWNLENRFTGWVDVDLTENGKLEAKKAGELIKTSNIQINYYYSSFQLRANHTMEIIKKILNPYFSNFFASGFKSIPMIFALFPKKFLHIKRDPPENIPISTKVIFLPRYFLNSSSYILK